MRNLHCKNYFILFPNSAVFLSRLTTIPSPQASKLISNWDFALARLCLWLTFIICFVPHEAKPLFSSLPFWLLITICGTASASFFSVHCRKMLQNQQLLLSPHMNNLTSPVYFYTKQVSHYFPNLIVLDYNIRINFVKYPLLNSCHLKISFVFLPFSDPSFWSPPLALDQFPSDGHQVSCSQSGVPKYSSVRWSISHSGSFL